MTAVSKVLTSIALIMATVIPAQAEYQSNIRWQSPDTIPSENIVSYLVFETKESQPFGGQYIVIIDKTAEGEINGYSHDFIWSEPACYKINVWTNDYVLHYGNSEVCVKPPSEPPAFCSF